MIALTVYLRGIDDGSHRNASGSSVPSTKMAASGPSLPQHRILCVMVTVTRTAYTRDAIIDCTDIQLSIACEQARANYVGSSLPCIAVGTAWNSFILLNMSYIYVYLPSLASLSSLISSKSVNTCLIQLLA